MSWIGWVVALQVGVTILGAVVWWVLGTVLNMFPFTPLGKWPTVKDRSTAALGGAVFVAAIFLLADSIALVAPYGHLWYFALVSRFGVQVTEILIAMGVLVFGVLAFLFKANYQRAYGVVEIVFAASLALVTAQQLRSQESWTATMMGLGGCVYVVSRGLGNYTDPSKSPAAREAAKLPQATGTA